MSSTPAFKPENRTILITEPDLIRLRHMIQSVKDFHHDRQYIDSLEDELEQAEVVKAERLPRNVVTINSCVRVTDLASNKRNAYFVVFPRDANYAERISVLAPIGAALLGGRVGDVVELAVPSGTKRLRIEGYPRG
jgi:regulator of nucleoside diphosphate kinase